MHKGRQVQALNALPRPNPFLFICIPSTMNGLLAQVVTKRRALRIMYGVL
jgi:hypothetical protein